MELEASARSGFSVVHSDRRVEHLQRIAHVCLAGPLDIFLGVRPSGSSRAFAWSWREVGRRGDGTRSDGGGVGSYPGVRSLLWSAAAKGRCRDYGADDQGSDHGGFLTWRPENSSSGVAGEIEVYRTCGEGASPGRIPRFPKGLTRQVFRCLRNGFNS